MTQVVPPSSQPRARETAAVPDVQRQSLDQIVRLSSECTAAEQRIEQEHTEAVERIEAEFRKTATQAQQARGRELEAVAADSAERAAAIDVRYQQQRQALEASTQTAQRQIVKKREDDESSLKKQLEQVCWHAESLCVAVEMKADTDEQKSKKDHEASQKELTALGAFETSAQEALAQCRLEVAGAASDAKPSAALQQRIAAERQAVLDEYRQKSLDLLKEIRAATRPRARDGSIPLLLMLLAAGGMGAGGWFLPIATDEQSKLIAAGGAAAATLVVGGSILALHRHNRRAKVRARAEELYGALTEALGVARAAAHVDIVAEAAARQKRVQEARQKRDQDVAAARDKVKMLQGQVAEAYRSGMARQRQRYQEQLAGLEQEKDRGLAERNTNHEQTTARIEHEHAQAQQGATARHDQALGQIEAEYARASAALQARWNEGLRAVSALMEGPGEGRAAADLSLLDWNSPAWAQWQPPREFCGHVRFGDMKVDLAQLTEQVPRRLKLPDTFSVPALLRLPAHASLFLEVDHAGRAAGIQVAQMVMARLLTQMPGGRVKFTLFDPVGLGQSFAGFMHLADHDESLVGARIWTEKEHMEQRLADLTEHMETVIQKYLRNEYATIDQYNDQAGELAEPIRFLVIADFPTGFEAEALRRLASIVTTGPKCGVYTIILHDTRQPIPPGARMEEILARSVRLVYKNGAFVWDDAVFRRFPLRVDPAPDEKALTALMDLVGKAAKEAKRVEVPFSSIAPAPGEFWSLSSKETLRVPIGKTGATRLQSLRLGVGVAQHTLVAGKTGSGKSNLMHTIITNLAMWYGPDEVEFYLVDFKKGVEFKAYVGSELPHARAIAVESDREFGLSVLKRVDAELTRRGAMFRDAGAQEIGAFRDRTGQKLPRCILLIDEFQEFFSEDDKLGQEASGLMDRLVRQGRAFGVHLILGSQTIGGTSGLGRSTLGQIAVRVALQCSEADSQMILGDNNSAARLLTRPGEAVYNDAGGLVEANSPFQIAFLPDGQREGYLRQIREVSQARGVTVPAPIVFEGNSAALIRKNQRLMALLESGAYPPAASAIPAFVGEPVAIKEPSAISFRRQSGSNVLLVGQQEESALAIFGSILATIAAHQKPDDARFFLMDGTPTDARHFGLLERLLAALPHPRTIVGWRQVPESIHELSTILHERQGGDARGGSSVFLLIFGLQRYRLLRRQEDDFSFRSGEGEKAPQPDKEFAELLGEGPPLGLHTIIWADTPITVERTLDRAAMRQFDYRVLFQMSANDSSNLIDSPLANRLGAHRALLYSEEQGTFEKFRPYQVPDDAWLAFVAQQLKKRPGS